MSKISAAGSLLLALLAAPVWGQTYEQQFDLCAKGSTPEQKIQACSAVIAANREPADAMARIYFTRGLMHRRLGQNDAALKDYNQSLRLAPSSDVYNSRCYLFAITNRLQDALKDCNEALRLNPRNQYAYDSRGFAYLKLGMLDAAVADYDAALAIEPGRPYSMAGRGFARRRKGDVAGGEADLAAARAQVPGIVEELARYGVK
ncbi:MAG: tetratricopeptide repeat protein [Reyranella sp.]|uniref:tetratricopeptide repeat protein n=1 Tax=Reyranella sp. TaxID=1929291 RepID=UPI001AC3E809|nr:tetratricopeptide repeat protein [Reyranella sp.]MBN9088673.1 tetratricopeptide repeat protein [Reyranella sp.]